MLHSFAILELFAVITLVCREAERLRKVTCKFCVAALSAGIP